MLCKSGRGLYSSNINFLQAPKCIFFNLFITLAYLTHFYCNVQWAYYLLVIKKIPMYLSIHLNIFKGSIMPFYSRQFNIFKPFCLVLSQLLWAPLTVVCDCLNEKLTVKLQPPVYDIKHRQSIFVWPSD